MKYIKFTIENYKGIPKIELDLNKQPQTNIFTLVGLNESGKTSILEAINRFSIDLPKDQAYLLIPKSKQHSFDGHVSIKAELELDENDKKAIKSFLKQKYKFDLTEDDETITIEKRYNFSRSRPLEDSRWKQTFWTSSFVGKTKQSKNVKKLRDWNNDAWNELIELIKDKFLPKVLYYPDFLFKFPEKIYLEESFDEGAEQAEYRGIIQDILRSIQDNLTLEENLLEKMRNSNEASDKAALEQLLLKMSSKLNEDILKKWDEIFGKTQKKEVEIKWGFETVPITLADKFYIELKVKQGSDTYSINDRSLGFRWFFSFLIFTAFRKARLTDPGETLFLLDEPASNLHQRSQQKLLQSLNEIVSNCKLVYSTHSHHLINPRWLAGTYIVRNKAVNYSEQEESIITETLIEAELYRKFVSNYPNEEDHFKPILDALDYTPSKLELVPFIVFTEGKNDYYTFKYMNEVIIKNKEINLYPGAGKDKYDLIFRLYIAWGRKFLAIFDSDDGGKKAKERYENDIGVDIKSSIFSLEDINSTWRDFETESLFSDTEKIKIIQKVFPEHKKEDGYIKSKFNTAIQQLYISKESFDFNKTTIEKFEAVFSFILKEFKKVS